MIVECGSGGAPALERIGEPGVATLRRRGRWERREHGREEELVGPQRDSGGGMRNTEEPGNIG